jgi:hypothetical protein
MARGGQSLNRAFKNLRRTVGKSEAMGGSTIICLNKVPARPGDG